jgi:diguanylate cyclase (GGDEF)-like protein
VSEKTSTIITVVSEISYRPLPFKAALVVIYGLELGRKFDLTSDSTVIGRSTSADIHIEQESISRSHAMVRVTDTQVLIQDLGSTNGTFVNDDPLQGERSLQNGDLIKTGRTIFKYIAGGNIEAVYHDEMYRLSTFDGLTQVANRRHFEETLEREISRCHRYGRMLSLALIDIDHFKQVNDVYGHLAGDHVLKKLAHAVKSRIRKEDLFARYGGEEFGLMLPELDVASASVVAEKIRRIVEVEPFEFDGKAIPVTVSVGVAGMGPDAEDVAALLNLVDGRLYEAKESGRNRVVA